MAQAYYDSAATSITPTAPEYKEITRIAGTLKDYITYLNTIEYQDSMLYLAELPKEELDSLITFIFEEEKKRQEEELQKQLDLLAHAGLRGVQPSGRSGDVEPAFNDGQQVP